MAGLGKWIWEGNMCAYARERKVFAQRLFAIFVFVLWGNTIPYMLTK
jgi:hypothetical protein